MSQRSSPVSTTALAPAKRLGQAMRQRHENEEKGLAARQSNDLLREYVKGVKTEKRVWLKDEATIFSGSVSKA
ncbi:hypothetical protein MRB53_016839 [Persea americana]|uniref:Uncharacterized protein n=1 Tax=Persea americana TaxID=3435 RepID=A0ACC2M3D1_PERAE|nr:hypothetical protein MRB53_016839 [Persea americana]